MVPKLDHTPFVLDFHPISYCIVFYKVISKVLASQLRMVIGSILDLAQATYVEDHSIVENIHLAQKLLRKYERKRVSPRCVLKVNLQKAFDTID